MHLTKIALTWDSRLAGYVTQVLQGSRRRLGENILGGMDLGDGEWFAWGIADRPFPASFEEGGLMPEAPEETWLRSETAIAKPIQGARQELCDELEGFLDSDARHCCLISNELHDIGEPITETLAERALLGRDVYHLLTNRTPRHLVMEVIRDADSIPISYGVLSCDTDLAAQRNALSEERFKAIIANARGLYVGAFDGESYLVFRRGTNK